MPWRITLPSSWQPWYHLSGITLGPFHERFFHHISNSMENWCKCNSIVRYHITTIFCTCNDSTTVVACVKFHSDHFTTIWMRAKWNFHRILITMEKSFVKWTPGPCLLWSGIYMPCAIKVLINGRNCKHMFRFLKFNSVTHGLYSICLNWACHSLSTHGITDYFLCKFVSIFNMPFWTK